MGESTSDFLVHRFPPVVAVLAGGVVFSVALLIQVRSSQLRTGVYWSTVVMVSVFGTMCADVVHVGFGVPYVVSTVAFAGALAAVFFAWQRREGTLSIHRVLTTQREIFYWMAVTVTFAFGTAVGDLVAYDLGLGYLRAGLVFTVVLSLITLSYRVGHTPPVATFWAAYVVTRPLGASFADWCGVSPARGGLNEGPGTVGLVLTGTIAVVVAHVVYRERRPKKPCAD